MPEAFQELPHICEVEVGVVREVGADVGVAAHQGAVEGSAAYADHHGDETQQEQDQAGISSSLFYKQNKNTGETLLMIFSSCRFKSVLGLLFF